MFAKSAISGSALRKLGRQRGSHSSGTMTGAVQSGRQMLAFAVACGRATKRRYFSQTGVFMNRCSIVLGLLVLAGLAPVATAAPCALSAADKIANAALSYDEFDQNGTLASSFRALDVAGCYALAADAAEDYLLHHPGLKDGERINLLFHEGQARAAAGEERSGAMVIAASRDLSQKPDDGFDWNTYVEGTWAFLVKDRAGLDAAATKLGNAPGEDNAINARVLRGLQRCFNRPYREAYGAAVCDGPRHN